MGFAWAIGLARGGAWTFRFRWGVGLLVFALLVYGKIHGFSLGAWDVLFPDATAEYRFHEIGRWRAIRSDEWRVSTPAVLAQCAHPDFFPRINDRIGGGMDMFLAMPACPVWDWTAVGQAHNWGYFLFGAERGLAWNWWIRYLGLFLFALEFFLIWTRGDKSLAVVGALAICWGAPTQWWDTSVPYLLLYFFAGLVCLFRMIAGRRLLAQGLWGVGLLVALCSYAYSFYPPFQLMLGYLWLLLAADLTRRAWGAGGNRRQAMIILGVVLGLVVAEGIDFLAVHREALNVIRHSAYPGHRLYLGGTFQGHVGFFAYALLCLFTAFRDVQFMNNCVVSVYAVPFVALAGLGLQAWRQRGKKRPWFGYVLCAYGGVLIGWMLFPWPESVAQCTGLFLVAPHRAPVGMSFVFLLLTFKAFDHCRRRAVRLSWPQTLGWLVAALLSLGILLRSDEKAWDYFAGAAPSTGIAMLVAGVGLFGVLGAGLLRVNRPLFLGGYLACSLLTGAFVHPLCVGASPLLHKQVAARAREIQREFGAGRWLTNEKSRAQLLIANGLACVNGIHFTAQTALWLAIDPARRFESTWNRYAHVSAEVIPGDASRAELQSRDQFVWKLCRADLDRLHVRYLLWGNEPLRMPWAIPLGRVGHNYFYRIADDVSATMAADHES